MDMIRCPRCAREIPDVSRFCRRCGCAIVWRAQILPEAAIPPLPARSTRATTLTTPRPVPARPVAAQATVKGKSGSGGAGVFAIFAAAGMVCFINYHAAVRPVVVPNPGTVRYQTPMLPVPPSRVSPPTLYPTPQRVSSPVTVRRRGPSAAPVSPPPTIVIEPPVSPSGPWEAEEYRPPHLSDDHTTGAESTAPDRSVRRYGGR